MSHKKVFVPKKIRKGGLYVDGKLINEKTKDSKEVKQEAKKSDVSKT